MNSIIQLDPSLERAIADERLDGRRSLLDDLRTGFHAKLVVGAAADARRGPRQGHAVRGDLDMREYARMSEAEFQALHSGVIVSEGFNDDTEDFYLSRCPGAQVRYVPRTAKVFMPISHGLIQAGKYSPARA